MTQPPRRVEGTVALPGGPAVPARLTLPDGSGTRWPTLVLFHGADPPDLDATVRAADGSVRSANFARLADLLPRRGIAVLRFTKRAGALIPRLVTDAAAVLAAARSWPGTGPLLLYGWSQGARVAAHAAEADGAVAGLVLHAGLARGWPAYFRHVLIDVAERALREIADDDGVVDVAALSRLPTASTSVATTLQYLVWDPAAPAGTRRLRPALDPGGRGRFSLTADWAPQVAAIVEDPTVLRSPFVEPAHEPATGLADVLASTGLPTLVLHGDRDGWVPPDEADVLGRAAPATVTVRRYPGLGHSLSPAASAPTDVGGPIDEHVVDDIAAWVHGVAGRHRPG